jgi:RNA polymerase sigma-70 factor (ECF subfamily)
MTASAAEKMVEAGCGAPAAFDDLFDRYEADLFRFARHLARDPDLAAELYQETWLRAVRQLRAWGGRASPDAFRRWLFTVVANLFRDELRRRQVRRRTDGGSLDDEGADAGRRAAAPAPDLSEQLALREGLARALDALSDRQRTAFLLVHAEGFRVREVADLLAVAEGTVKSTLHRAARIMQRTLQDFRP